MKLTIDAVNKAGTGFKAGDEWYNKDKYSNPSFEGLRKGVTVDVVLSGETTFVKSLTILDSVKAETKETTNRTTQKTSGTSEEIARSVAVKAVLDSPIIAAQLQNTDFSEAMSLLETEVRRVTNYVLTGNFVVRQESREEVGNETK